MPGHRQIVQCALSILPSIVLVVWWPPQLAGTTWSVVFFTLSPIGFGATLMLFGLLCLRPWCYPFTLTWSLMGLRHV